MIISENETICTEPTPPQPLPVEPENIPVALAERDQWVCWRYKRRPDPKHPWTKRPLNPRTGNPASVTDPQTWGTLQQALDYAAAHDLPGIGFVFTADDPLAGIDLDGVLDPETGELAPEAAAIVRALGSYTEVSPSGTGIHTIVKGNLPPEGRSTQREYGKIETYECGRYFTFTGHRLPKTPPTVRRRQKALDAFHTKTFPPAPPRPPQPAREASPTGTFLEDDALIERARNARNGGKFATLYQHGDTSGYASASEADLALLSLAAFWTQDEDQLDRVYRRSAICREKWERADYRSRTIARAMERSETYTAPTRITATSATAAPSDAPTDDPAETDTCRLELADLRRELAEVRQERDAARAAMSMAIQVMLNPNITATEKVAIVALNGIVQHKRDTGQLEPDGSVIVSAAEISDDWRKAPPPGERVAPHNQTGSLPRMARDRVKPLLAAATERGVIAAEPRTVVRTGPGGTAYKETTWALDPASTAEFLAPAASWRPAEPVARKPRRIAIPCSSCGEVHPIIRTDVCEGCGTVRDRRKIEPVSDLEAATTPTLPASDNLSDIRDRHAERGPLNLLSDDLSEVPETSPGWFPPAHTAQPGSITHEWQSGAPSATVLQDEPEPERGDPWSDDDDAYADQYGVV